MAWKFCNPNDSLHRGRSEEIMIRRGIFKNHWVRSNSKPLDEYDMAEIDRTWEMIQPYLTWHKA